MEFSMDHDWCAVVKKLLDVLLDGTVGTGAREHPFLKPTISEMGLIHRAIRRNSRPLVECLLRYVPEKVSDELKSELSHLVGGAEKNLFRPDVVGPSGLTPLHVAAGRDGCEDVLDALTDDPGKDVAAKILSFSQKGPPGICVLSANGTVSFSPPFSSSSSEFSSSKRGRGRPPGSLLL